MKNNIYYNEYWRFFDNTIKYSMLGSFLMFINNSVSVSSRWKYLKSFLPTEKRFFDIGAGRGHHLRFFKDKGFYTAGIEPDKIYSSKLSEYNVVESSIEEYKVRSKFGIVSATHVIEHLENPDVLLSKAKELMNYDSILFIEVPNCSTEELLKEDKSDFHLHHFSRNTLKGLLERNGFRILDLSTFSPKMHIDKGDLIIRIFKNILLIVFYLTNFEALRKQEEGMYLRAVAKII